MWHKQRHDNQTENEDYTIAPRVTLPYIKGKTNKLSKILRNKNVRVSFAPRNALRGMLDNAKDSINLMQRKGVYSIPYYCGKTYIGETRCSV